MIRFRRNTMMYMHCILMLFAIAYSPAMYAQFESAPAFPGAEGFGRYTTGGREGTIYHVTSLEDYVDDSKYGTKESDSNHKGTLRYAIRQSGKRIVVFDVAGTIELKCPLKIKNDNITILGQTAPGDGICLRNYTFNISASNVIVRFIRSRMGNSIKDANGNTAVEDDAMNCYHGDAADGTIYHNVIIDHCSVSWSVDECGSFYGNKDFTLQWCILSESLRNAGHVKGAHGYGGIWGGENASFHHNLLADHDSRNPRFDHDYVSTMRGPIDFVNNAIYNWGGNSSYGGESCNAEGKYRSINMINNYYKPGPYTKASASNAKKTQIVNPTTKCTNCTGESTGLVNIVPAHFYIAGNYMDGSSSVTSNNWTGVNPDDKATWGESNLKLTSRAKAAAFDYNTISMQSAATSFDKILAYAGASFARDIVDDRVCNDTKSGTFQYNGSNGSTNGIIDSPEDVGGWPKLTGTAKTDSDNDGMPDEWESENGLNPNEASDASTYTLDKNGYYTNIEVYANWLVEGIIKAGRADAVETFEEYYPIINSETPETPGDSNSPDTPEEPSDDDAQATTVYAWTTTGEVGGTASVVGSAEIRSGSYLRLTNSFISGANYIDIALNKALKGGETLTLQYYITNKDTKNAQIGVDFTNSTRVVATYLDDALNVSGGTASDTYTIEVPESCAGCDHIHLYRQSGVTGIFVTEVSLIEKALQKIELAWDFSEFSEKTTTDVTDYRGLHLVLNGGSTSDFVSATEKFHCIGTSNATRRYIKYTPSTDGILTVAFRSNSSSDQTRTTGIGIDFNSQIAVAACSEGTVSANLTAGTTYYVYFVSGGQTITKLDFKNYYTVKTNANGYSTFCATEATAIPQGLTAYTGQLNSASNAVVLTEIEQSVLPSKAGVLIKGMPSTDYDFIITSDAAPLIDNIFVGTTMRTANPDITSTYCLSTQNGETAFYLYTGDNIPANKAYISFASAEVKAFCINIDGETAVDEISAHPLYDGMLYNLSGQRVSDAYRGIVIKNGKKYYNR